MNEPERMGFYRITHDEMGNYRGDRARGSGWCVGLEPCDPRDGRPGVVHLLDGHAKGLNEIFRDMLNYDSQYYPEGFGLSLEGLALEIITAIELDMVAVGPLSTQRATMVECPAVDGHQ